VALTASDGADNDSFGSAVALSGDMALIGAPGHTVGGHSNQGAAYVFTRSGTTWSQQGGDLKASDGAVNDFFGSAVGLSGSTALVGALGHTVNGHSYQGAAYVFTRSGTTWSQQGGDLTASDGAANDHFGCAVALSGDAALIGAPNHTVGSNSDQGAAYVFTRSGASWSWQATLTATGGAVDDLFGSAVALSGDTALVGTPYPNGQGAAYGVFLPPTITPTVAAGQGTISPSTPQIVSYGATPSFTFAPAAGYHVATVSVDGSPVTMTAANTYTFPAVSADYTLAVSFATPPPPSTPTLHLKLSGLKHGALKLGKRLTAKGTVTPSSLAGGKVTLTVQRRQGSKWRKVKSVARTISASGAYGWKYKPAKKGSYRIQATIAKMATHTAAASKWRTFKVK
jgi:hypothetical protein